ncbi:Uncharacterised protein [Acidipropionibacterium jensenii]|uniref:Uncharacterized protein n=1 Tax=Acidipropionibacterium jensenii TaxID=1749 RepID=A0A3S4YQE3_9ACTN|nr:hypothetical protein [Acidipropionibacterium jensenii]VEI03919.1 Uncharacterised protein [Acidipropionibacterium jensenii]
MDETAELGAAEQLLSAVRDLAASTGEAGISRAERVTRSRRAAEALRDVPQVLNGLDPYADGQHSRVRDLVLTAEGPVAFNPDGPGVDHQGRNMPQAFGGEAAVRAAQDRLRVASQLADVRARAAGLGFADVGEVFVAPPAAELPGLAAWLDGYAQPVTASSAAKLMTPVAWDAFPAGVINPGTSNPADAGTDLSQLEGDEKRYTLAGWSTSRSAQVVNWGVNALAELDRLGTAVADVALEAELIRQLADGAPAAANLEAAEVACGQAWPSGADLILCHAADRPKIVRSYAAAQLGPADRPLVLATGGVREPGTAYVVAMGGVWLEASPIEAFSMIDPKVLGTQLGWLRYGQVTRRAAGVVQKVEVAA